MTRRKTITMVGVALLFAMTAANVHGWVGQRNRLQFNRAVTLPGVVLLAGEYQFEMVTSGGAGDVVLVRDRNGKPQFMGMTRTIDRPRHLSSKNVIILGESPAGTPPPIKTWYPIEGGNGHEFIYR